MAGDLYRTVVPRLCISVLAAIGTMCSVERAAGAWSADPTVNTGICTDLSTQTTPVACPDGSGGAVVFWLDQRGSDTDVYAQRLNASGEPQWSVGGVVVSSAAGNENSIAAVADGAGGAIVVWQDYRSGAGADLYAQKLDASGAKQWTATGVAVCTDPSSQSAPVLASDGQGGAVVAWSDNRLGGLDIYAQRLNASGAVLWAAGGTAVCTAANGQILPAMTAVAPGEVILSWADARGGAGADIYAQRLDASGAGLWTAGGDPVCTASGSQLGSRIVPDGSGGAIVAWEDQRTGSGSANSDLYAQRVTTGSLLWASDGVALTTAPQLQAYPTLVPDGAGGVTAAWHDLRNGATYRIFAQKVSSAGAVLWAANGLEVTASSGHQVVPSSVDDGAGGVILVWADYRSGSNGDIYAQRLSAAGTALWGSAGIAVSTAASTQFNQTVVMAAAGGAIVAWEDERNGAGDIYAARITSSGQLPARLSAYEVE